MSFFRDGPFGGGISKLLPVALEYKLQLLPLGFRTFSLVSNGASNVDASEKSSDRVATNLGRVYGHVVIPVHSSDFGPGFVANAMSTTPINIAHFLLHTALGPNYSLSIIRDIPRIHLSKL